MKLLATRHDRVYLLILAAVIALTAILRFYKLGKIPVSMSDDEIRETMSAVSLWQTGYDLSGKIRFPMSFFIDGFTFTPVPVYVSAPFTGILGLSMVTARLPYALAGVLSVLTVYLLALRLLKNRNIAVLSGTVMAISVWHIQISRFAVETGFALLFYVLGIWLFLEPRGKYALRRMILSMTAFFLAFHSYNATKVIYLPIVLLLTVYEWNSIARYKRLLAVIAGGIILTGVTFAFSAVTQNAARHGGTLFVFQQSAAAAEAVGAIRSASSIPEPFRTLYMNKYTYFTDVFLRQYLFAFSPQFLLLDQEANGIYAVYGRGQLYLIEGPLLILGALFLARRRKRGLALILVMLLLAPLPSGIAAGATSYGMRSSFMLPWLSVLIASGIVSIGALFRNPLMKRTVWAVIAVSYAYSVTGYLNYYYRDWIKRGAKHYAKGTQDLIRQVGIERTHHREVIVAGDANTVRHFAFYEKIPAEDIRLAENGQSYRRGNIRFETACITPPGADPRLAMPGNSVYFARPSCHRGIKEDGKIVSHDGDTEWMVYETK